MARPKSPKKSADVKQLVPTRTEPAISDPFENPVESAPANEITRVRAARAPRKPEAAGVAPRANLVPFNLDDEIRTVAYLLSEQRGFVPGHETEDWLNAEREVLGRFEQQRA